MTGTVVHVVSAEDAFGPEKTVINECLALSDTGWRAEIVNLWPTDDTPFVRKARDAGISTRCIASRRALDVPAMRALAGVLRRSNTIAHSHGYKADLYTLLVGRWAGIPCVTTIHGWTSENYKVRMYEGFQARSWRFFDRVIAVSESYSRIAIEYGVSRERLRVVRNAIKTNYAGSGSEDRNTARRELGFGADAIVVAVVGRLGIEKGHRLLLEAAAVAFQSEPRATLAIIGDGDQRAALEDLVGTLGLMDRAVFLGHRNDLPRLYPGIDILAITSLREGLPNVLLEAMLHGIPAVAMDVGGIPEVIADDVNGLLVPAGDVSKYIVALRRAIGSPVLRQHLGAAARIRVRSDFLFERRMQQMTEIYDQLLYEIENSRRT